MQEQTSFPFDALMPPEMAGKAENVGVNKAQLNSFRTFALAILAGAFIAMGAIVPNGNGKVCIGV
jgi:formate/nitrite transporter FocA (FNT family)